MEKLDLEKLYLYFQSIDTSQDKILSRKEVRAARKSGSIFSSYIKKGMDFDALCNAAAKEYVKNVEIKDNNEGKLPYRLEDSAEPEVSNWTPVTKVLTKDEVDKDRFNIKTKEGEPIEPALNFNTPDGEYMLKYLSFDSVTFSNTPPENLPDNFNPDEIIESGKTMGQNVDKMHALGYTGKGITVADVDFPILTNHEDIKSSIVGYEVMDKARAFNATAQYHGQATSGILSGDECGTAPDSKLVYFACTPDNPASGDGIQALKRIIEINKTAKPDEKIKVVSLSWGAVEGDKGYNEFTKLLKELYDDGVAVFTADFNMLNPKITGAKDALCIGQLERKEQNGDPNDFSNYKEESAFGDWMPERVLFFNAGDRTVPSAQDENSFRHDSASSTSWTVPAAAGIYASALQCAEENGVDFNIEKFWDYGLMTGKEMYDDYGNFIGKAVDAEALVKYIESLKQD